MKDIMELQITGLLNILLEILVLHRLNALINYIIYKVMKKQSNAKLVNYQNNFYIQDFCQIPVFNYKMELQSTMIIAETSPK